MKAVKLETDYMRQTEALGFMRLSYVRWWKNICWLRGKKRLNKWNHELSLDFVHWVDKRNLYGISEKEMATHSSILAWRILWTEEPGGLLPMGSHRVGHDWSDLACVYALEKEMATHSSILAWRIPGTEKPVGLLSMGLHRVRHDWSDLAAAAMVSQSSTLPWPLFCFPCFTPSMFLSISTLIIPHCITVCLSFNYDS